MCGDSCDLEEGFIRGVGKPNVHFESLGPVNARNKTTGLEHSEESVTVSHITYPAKCGFCRIYTCNSHSDHDGGAYPARPRMFAFLSVGRSQVRI